MPAPQKIAKDDGAPFSLVATLLVAGMFLPAVVLHDSLSLAKDYYPSLTVATLLLQGFAVCFYWRRIQSSLTKSLAAFGLAFVLWCLMLGIPLTGLNVAWISKSFDILRTLAAVSLVVGTFCSFIFVLLWGSSHEDGRRWRTTALTLCAMVLGVGMVLSTHRIESMPHLEKMSLSARNLVLKSTEGADGTCAEILEKTPFNFQKDHLRLAKIAATYSVGAGLRREGTGLLLDWRGGGEVALERVSYPLKTVTFYSPSRQTLAGQIKPLEILLQHQSSKGELLTLSIFADVGLTPEPLAAWISDAAQRGQGAHHFDFNPQLFLTSDDVYAQKQDCQGHSQVLVAKKPLRLSRSDIAKLAGVIHTKELKKTDANHGGAPASTVKGH